MAQHNQAHHGENVPRGHNEEREQPQPKARCARVGWGKNVWARTERLQRQRVHSESTCRWKYALEPRNRYAEKGIKLEALTSVWA